MPMDLFRWIGWRTYEGHLRNHAMYSELLQETCLYENTKCLFHVVSFNRDLHADVWRSFVDYCARQMCCVVECGHIVVPSPTHAGTVHIRRPENCLKYAPSSDTWLKMCRELVNCTGSEWVYRVLTRSEAVRHDSPSNAIAVAFSMDSSADVKDALQKLRFSNSLLDSIWRYHREILQHMSPDQIVEMIIERALFHMGRGKKVPSNGGYPANFPTSLNMVQAGAAPCRMNYDHLAPSNANASNPILDAVRNIVGGGGFRRLYHGTSWLNANSIVRGINLQHSRVDLDFGPGFYVGENLRMASLWARRFNQAAVVIFLIPNEVFENRPFTYLETDGDAEWRRITNGCRNEDAEVLLEMALFGCITGPMVANPHGQNHHGHEEVGEEAEEAFVPLIDNNTNARIVQHCFKSEPSVQWLHRYLKLVVYFREDTQI